MGGALRKSRKKKYNFRDKADKMIVGLILEWSDTAPTVDDNAKTVMRATHANPTRRTYAREMAATALNYIKNERPFMWLVDMSTFFVLDNGKEFVAESQLKVWGTLDGFNDEMIAHLEEDRRKGPESGYSHVKFKIECIGKNPPPPIEHELAKELRLLNGAY